MKIRSLLLAAILCVSGCLGKTPPSTFYLLETVPEIQTTQLPVLDEAAIGLGPIEFPEYASRPQIVIRNKEVQIGMNEFRRWAAPIDAHFSQVLSEDLSWFLKGRKVLLFPWRNEEKPTKAVRVKVLQFEGNMDRYATLTVDWELYSTISEHVIYEERQRWVMPLSDDKDYYHAYILAMSENVAQLAKRIAGKIADPQ
jgi:uncharacterized lipoprotein YmbA